MTLFIASQLIATGAFILDVSAFFFTGRVQTLRCLALSTFFMSAHFILLSQWSAATLMLIASCRYLTATQIRHGSVMWLFIGISIASGLFTWQRPADLLPVSGSLLHTFAAFRQHFLTLRLFTAAGSLCWFVNNLLCHSPVAAVMEASFLLSTLISCFWLKKRTQEA